MELDPEMASILAPSEKDIKRTMINMLKNLVKKSDQYMWTNRDFQQRERSYEKVKWVC